MEDQDLVELCTIIRGMVDWFCFCFYGITFGC